MALRAEVVDLIGLHLLNDLLQVAAVAQVAVVQRQAWIQLVRILIEVINPGGVEAAGPALVPARRSPSPAAPPGSCRPGR